MFCVSCRSLAHMQQDHFLPQEKSGGLPRFMFLPLPLTFPFLPPSPSHPRLAWRPNVFKTIKLLKGERRKDSAMKTQVKFGIRVRRLIGVRRIGWDFEMQIFTISLKASRKISAGIFRGTNFPRCIFLLCNSRSHLDCNSGKKNWQK